MAVKYFHWQQNRPNGHKIYLDFPLQDPPKFTQNWYFCLENKPSGNPARGGGRASQGPFSIIVESSRLEALHFGADIQNVES
jgi:hypothetical protein